jgi:hypothetical protein
VAGHLKRQKHCEMMSTEEAHAAGADQQAYDDESDTGQDRSPQEPGDPQHDQDHRDDP